MNRSHTITGIDIGSSKIRIAVAKYDDNSDDFHIIGVAEHPSSGVINGSITNIEDVVSSISATLEKVERITGLPVEKAVIGVSGSQIKFSTSQGVIAVTKADGEIKDEDLDRVLEAAQAVATPPNYEILHVIPKSYKVDNQEDVKDPIGMNGVRLEVNAQIIMSLSSQIKTITKCIYRTGVDIQDLVFSTLADSESVLNREQKELGVILVNIGSATTGIAVFEEGNLLHTNVLPIGSAHITNDLAIGLRTSIKTAEKIKVEYATCLAENVRQRDNIDLSEIDPEEQKRTMVSKYEISKITQARVEEIFNMVGKELKKIERFGMLPAGVVLSGGGSKLNGIVELVKKELQLPVFLAKTKKVNTVVEQIYDLSYSNVLGLILWEDKNKAEVEWSSAVNFGGIVTKIRKWLRSLMP